MENRNLNHNIIMSWMPRMIVPTNRKIFHDFKTNKNLTAIKVINVE